MTDPIPPAGAPAARSEVPATAGRWAGAVPERVGGPFYSTGLVILLTIVTLGIWPILWTYRTGEDLKAYNGDGLGGVLGAVLYIFVSPVVMFTIPNEIKNAYERDGRDSPVTALWGLWFLLPLIGHVIWYVRVQRALNELWISKGAAQG
jgi:hypothetical protein